MRLTLRPGLAATLTYRVPPDRTVPHADLSHQAPTLPGDTLTVATELTEVNGRQLTFFITAADGAGVVCQGTHRRAVIDRARFDSRLATRARAAGEQKES
jgi:predicted thioesterase